MHAGKQHKKVHSNTVVLNNKRKGKISINQQKNRLIKYKILELQTTVLNFRLTLFFYF